jgi:hypothetical protein
MTIKPNAFVVMDTETSGFSKLVFDFGWTTIDKHGNVLGKADMVFFDVAVTERPYFINKVKGYGKRMDKGVHRTTSFATGRRLFNMHIAHLQARGYRVILCAYNAAFDVRALGITTKRMKVANKFLRHSVELLDIWGNWAISAPKAYTAPKTKSGKFMSTSAENVYRFESQQPDFVEAHTAYEDTKIEAEILLKILKRKKRIKIVKSPRDFDHHIWENFPIAA